MYTDHRKSNNGFQLFVEYDPVHLHIIIRFYHEEFLRIQSENEAMKALAFGNAAKEEGIDGKPYVMYLYAAKEYIFLNNQPRNEKGAILLQKDEYDFFNAFRTVINGGQLKEQEEKNLQNYIYPKYQGEIEGLIEPDFDFLLHQLRK